ERQRTPDRGGGRTDAPGQRQPDHEWPEEELECDRRAGSSRGLRDRVARAPRNGDGEQQQRRDRAEVDRTPRERKDGGERVAAPVAHAEQPERETDRRQRNDRPHDRRG